MLHTKIVACVSICFPVYVFGQVGFVCPDKDIAETQCMGAHDCLYPDPDSCTTYIKCEVNADGETARAYVVDCPAGLEWSNDDLECVYPEDSTCPR
jgi:hypothetical protein